MWLTESNRHKHLIGGFIAGLVSFFFALGLGLGMELKDKWYGNTFDWVDFLLTLFGGIIGQGIQLLIIRLCIG